MKRTLFQQNSPDVEKQITATFENGDLVIEGYEKGDWVRTNLGDEDFEYALILPENSVAELRHVLNLNPFARKDLLEMLAIRFDDADCFGGIKRLLQKFAIRYKEYSWA